MSRNKEFSSRLEPLHKHPSLEIEHHKTTGPFAFLNPTQAHYKHVDAKSDPSVSDVDQHPSGLGYKWTSRNNRKGRHLLTLTQSAEDNPAIATPARSSTGAQIASGIWRMLVRYPFYDVSFDVAYIFTWGSIVWVINAFFSLLPFTNPDLDFSGETLYAGGISAFIGATIFEVGSVLLMFEAVNENRSGCFGWAVEQLLESDDGATTRISKSGTCTHHHRNKSNFVGSPDAAGAAAIADKDRPEIVDGTPPGARSWTWWPTLTELKTHYIHDLGFLACSSQMFGATIFWISGFTALPGINNVLSPGLTAGIYWVPQVIGGSGFIVSGTLFMIETQKAWWRPAPDVLGWHIGLWNLIGGIGFTLCPCFGFSSAYWSQQQAAVSTFWGSWAFLIGSVVQWYESLDKYPVERKK